MPVLLVVAACDPALQAPAPQAQTQEELVRSQPEPLELGMFDSEKRLRLARAGDAIEIVQGPQAGIHLELGFQLNGLDAEKSALKVEVSAATYAGCGDEARKAVSPSKAAAIRIIHSGVNSFFTSVAALQARNWVSG